MEIDESSHGLRCWAGNPQRMVRPHTHTDVECNLVFSGQVRYFLSGRFSEITPGRLAVFWAGTPHRMLDAEPQSQFTWLTIPLGWFLQWELDESFTNRLLAGELILARADDPAGAGDGALLERWHDDLASGDPARRQVAALEIRARLARLALVVAGAKRAGHGPVDDAPAIERLAGYVATHYREAPSVEEIGRAAGLHPNYAMQLFKRSCGMSLWEYLTRLRISHAQRLLATSDWKIDRVARECGFVSAGRFYAAFSRFAGCTPRKYRLSTRSLTE